MQRIALVVMGFLLVSAGAWAGPQASDTSNTAKSVASLNQRVVKNQADIDRLQKDVGLQESASHEAAERLQQQDRTIAQLREQLKAAQEASKTPAAGH
jgi:septal ring factor EnvC (AmiA/AmiB activator)